EDMGAVFVDFDADGDLDLYVASGGVECGDDDVRLKDRLYENDGAGVFVRAADGVVPDIRRSSSCVAAADFDRDGDVDLFVGSRVIPGRFPHAPASALLRNDDGRFVDVTEQVAPACRSLGMVSSACWTDLDDDGFVDLVVAAQWQPVRVLGNRGGEQLVDRTAELGIGEIRGQWNGVTSADIDGDGDADLVVSNLGLNTKYHASPDKPMQLFARDFDGNGTMDVVEAKRTDDRTLPVRGLSCSSQAMPFVREKFPTFDAFARANLRDIYGEALAESLSLTCNELRHVVFENAGGRFVMHPLPRRAQISTGFGVLDAGVIPGADLLLAHNFFSPEPETGRTDGGLGVSLRHVGGFAFAATTGRYPGDSRGLLRFVDRTGAINTVHVRNDAPHLLDSADRGEEGLRVRLAGPAGNPTGIGAKITFRRSQGAAVVREVLAGDGYLTHSSAVLAFPRDRGTFVVRWPDGHRTTFEIHDWPEQNELVTLRP
ncbi:MAG TPA: CRTAC1 family protein, partial [bacterium]|nr:CRTAC1 family protein [bacterium]